MKRLAQTRLLGLLLLLLPFHLTLTTADDTSNLFNGSESEPISSSASVPTSEATTITSSSLTQLASQSRTYKIDAIDREIESSVLKEILIPTNSLTESCTIIQPTSIVPLSSRSSTATSSVSSQLAIIEPSITFIPTDQESNKSELESESEFNINTESVETQPELTSQESHNSTQFEYTSGLSVHSISENIESAPTSLSVSITPLKSSELGSSGAIETLTSTSSGSESESGSELSGSTSEEESQQPPDTPNDLSSNDSNYSHTNISLEDLDDLSDDTQFLSFEEWKKKKGADTNTDQQKEPEAYLNRIPKNPAAKDSIGEEMEIDISNFFEQSEPEGKLYKDKFNFASFDCAATIVKTNSEAKGATSILFENKDSYLLNPCSAPNKFVIIELCQDILVDSVVMGNFEFFSSTFKKIQISVSETFPVPQNGWKILGQFDARDVRDFQTFAIENPMIWAKYFRIEILEHYGSEFYCPLSVVRVHGRTMMQEYKQEEALQISKTKELEIETEKNKLAAKVEEAINSETSKSQQQNCASQHQHHQHHHHQQQQQSTETQIVDCILTNQTVNNSIKNIQKNLTNITGFEANDECYISLPQLKFDDIFNDYQNDQSKCDSMEYNDSMVNQKNNTTIHTTTTTQSSSNSNTGTQESIYKNIMKRLSLLESNATLSVLYIEEQSKLLSNAFLNLEKKQSLKFDKLIDTFNTSLYNQLDNLSTLYSLFQKQTDELLTNQRLKHEHLLHDANHRIEILTSDLKFQKVLSFINGLILICILVYVVITRDTYIEEYNPSTSISDTNDKYRVMSLSKNRIASTGSRLKANIKRRIYNKSDGNIEYDSSKSLAPSDEEIVEVTTPSSNEKQDPIESDTISHTTGFNKENRPPTPDNSDHE